MSVVEEGGARRSGARTALVASVPPQEGQAFVVGALVAASPAESGTVRDALLNAAQAEHLALDAQAWSGDKTAQTALLEGWQSRHADALLVCALQPDFKAEDIHFLQREASQRQIPVVVANWEQDSLPAAPGKAVFVTPAAVASGAKQSTLMTAQTTVPAIKGISGRHSAAVTLYHNGKMTRKTLTATPQELGEDAVATISATLRGEKVKPVPKSKPFVGR